MAGGLRLCRWLQRVQVLVLSAAELCVLALVAESGAWCGRAAVSARRLSPPLLSLRRFTRSRLTRLRSHACMAAAV